MHNKTGLGALIISIIVLVGCKTSEPPSTSSNSTPPPSTSSEKPKIIADNSSKQKGEQYPFCNKIVTDSTKIEGGQGCKVKGINDWEGEISGVPKKGSKFAKLKIGMGTNEVIALIGSPTDSGAHLTGKAFIPFYFGSDKTRIEYVYKNQGRLLFATSQWGSNPGLIWIIHNSTEPGNR